MHYMYFASARSTMYINLGTYSIYVLHIFAKVCTENESNVHKY